MGLFTAFFGKRQVTSGELKAKRAQQTMAVAKAEEKAREAFEAKQAALAEGVMGSADPAIAVKHHTRAMDDLAQAREALQITDELIAEALRIEDRQGRDDEVTTGDENLAQVKHAVSLWEQASDAEAVAAMRVREVIERTVRAGPRLKIGGSVLRNSLGTAMATIRHERHLRTENVGRAANPFQSDIRPSWESFIPDKVDPLNPPEPVHTPVEHVEPQGGVS